jgi:plasmid replication initiation protein|tara:strand:+ start:192 stop:1238 length:1047 start_codon:yes stop_codon:yes gene_type:complete
MTELPAREPLLPDRMQQGDFFLCDIFDAAPKADMAGMEHPIFSISTKPDRNLRRYENGSNFVEITPSVKGIATVHDRDVLIYCISQLIAALNAGRDVSPTLRFSAHDMLKATNRMVGGDGYNRLRAALQRLAGTRIETNIVTGGTEELDGFGLIDDYKIVRESREGRMQELEVTLSRWVFSAIQAREVLTLSRDYFRLRKPLERRLYEIARKHCGAKREWKIGLVKLKAKCGSSSTDREFRRLLGKIIYEDQAHGHMPDYAIRMDEEGKNVLFISRGSVPVPVEDVFEGALPSHAHEDARSAAPGWDPRYLEQEWRRWCGIEEIEPKHPGRHYVKFCESWFTKRGRPG